MQLIEQEQHLFLDILEKIGLAWWIEISTNQPQCTYYFGPFASVKEAQLFQPGYIEDLTQEQAQVVAVEIKRCQPKLLTSSSNL